MFHIGDRVRFVDDPLNENWSIVNIYTSINKVQVFSKNQNVAKVVDPSAIVSTDTDEIKQAIREVLLSDEFLSAFAKAFANTPIPSTIQSVGDLSKGLVKAWTCEDGKAKQVYPEQPQPPDGYRWLEIGEVIRKGDRCFTNHSGSIDCLTSVGEKFNHQAHYPTIRRNRFEVGEKVVLKDSDAAWEVEKIIEGRLYKIKKLPAEYSTFAIGNQLAPYIEETKPIVDVSVEVTGEVKNPLGCPYGWRWLEVGEMICKGDMFFNKDHGWRNYDLSTGQKLSLTGWPSIRRNRFVVGEKVVHVPSEGIFQVVDVTDRVRVVDADGSVSYYWPEVLAPYIEETT